MSDCKDCLDGLLGLTQNDCECYEDDRPTDFNESSSGYYITDSQYGIPLKNTVFAAEKCTSDGQNIWEVMQQARDEAKRDLCSDLKKGIYTLNERYKRFDEAVGQKKGNAFTVRSYAGQKWKAKKAINGASFCTSKISVGVNFTGTVTVNLYDITDVPENQYSTLTPLKTVDVDTIANQWVTVDFENDLKTVEDNCLKEYLFLYELPAGSAYIENKFACCGNKPKWKAQIDTQGVYGDSADLLSCKSRYGGGLSVQTSYACDGLDWICKLDQIKGHDFTDVLGATLLFKTVAKLINRIERNGQVNYFTVLSPEKMTKTRHTSISNYRNNLQFIIENIPGNLSDCFKCAEKIKSGKILI